MMLENYEVVKCVREEASADEILDFDNTLCALAGEDEVARELAYKLGIEMLDAEETGEGD